MAKQRTEAEKEYYREYYKKYRLEHPPKYNKDYYREYYKKNAEKRKQQRLADREAELILKNEILEQERIEQEIKNQLKLENDLIIRKILSGYVKRLEYVFKFNQMNELDYYRVVDIHLCVFGYSNKYDILSARKQVEKMLDDLLQYLSDDNEQRIKESREESYDNYIESKRKYRENNKEKINEDRRLRKENINNQ